MQRMIRADRVILRADEPAVEKGAVLIEDGKIVASGERSAVESRASKDAVVSDYPGGTILPGLMDAHIHLSFDGTPSTIETMTAEDDATQILAMASRARAMVRSGVTTVRDLGDRNGLAVRLRDAINAGHIEGPRILAANAPVTISGGHCWFLGGEADGIDAIRRVVRRNIREGADVIKVMASGGAMTARSVPGTGSQFSVEELRVVVEESHRFGKQTAAHSHNAESTARAVEAGIDTIEHCGWGTESGQVDRRPRVMESMVRQGIFISPTVGAVMTRPPYESFAPMVIESLKWYREMGVKLVGSTDAGAIGTGFDEYASTFPLWLEAGFTTSELLTILTLNSAQAMQLDDRVGQLAEGFEADLIVVAGDPLKDISSMERVSLVIAQGRQSSGDEKVDYPAGTPLEGDGGSEHGFIPYR